MMNSRTPGLFEAPLALEAAHNAYPEAPVGPGLVPPANSSPPSPFVQTRTGRLVGNVVRAANNLCEDVRSTLDRLHLLWSINNADYDREYPLVSPPTCLLRSSLRPADIPLTIAAIGRNQAPTLHRVVAGHFLNLALTDNVGLGQRNNNGDIVQVQDILYALDQINFIDYTRERSAVLSMRPSLSIPSSIQSQLLKLPNRGCFTTATALSGCQVNIIDFCHRNRHAINTILQQENSPLGLKCFIDSNDLVRFGTIFSAEVYSHHFFVAEIAHEITN